MTASIRLGHLKLNASETRYFMRGRSPRAKGADLSRTIRMRAALTTMGRSLALRLGHPIPVLGSSGEVLFAVEPVAPPLRTYPRRSLLGGGR